MMFLAPGPGWLAALLLPAVLLLLAGGQSARGQSAPPALPPPAWAPREAAAGYAPKELFVAIADACELELAADGSGEVVGLTLRGVDKSLLAFDSASPGGRPRRGGC